MLYMSQHQRHVKSRTSAGKAIEEKSEPMDDKDAVTNAVAAGVVSGGVTLAVTAAIVAAFVLHPALGLTLAVGAIMFAVAWLALALSWTAIKGMFRWIASFQRFWGVVGWGLGVFVLASFGACALLIVADGLARGRPGDVLAGVSVFTPPAFLLWATWRTLVRRSVSGGGRVEAARGRPA